MPLAFYIGLTKKLLLLWACCWLWLGVRGVRGRSRNLGSWSETFIIVLAAVWLIAFGIIGRPMDHDEVEHLHSAWLVGQGQIPFRDFWQHHSPMMYVLFAPLVKAGIDPIYIPLLAKTVVLALMAGLAVLCWFMARFIWGADARAKTYGLLWIALLPLAEFFTPRPDAVATALVFAGLFVLVHPGRYTVLRYLVAGFLQGLGLSFSPKLYLVLLAPVIASLRHSRWRALPKLIVFGVGVVAGAVPLLVYLLRHDLVAEFWEWVIQFNLKHQVPAGFQFHPVFLGLGLAGAWKLLSRVRGLSGEPALLLLLAYLFVGIAALQNPLLHIYYYAAPWMILTAVMASSMSVSDLLERAVRHSRSATAAAALGLALLLYPTMLTLIPNRSESAVPTADWKTWSALCRLSENEAVLALAPVHPIFAEDAIGLYSDWQSTFTYLDPKLRDALADRCVLTTILQRRPATISGSTMNVNQHIADFLLDVELISPAGHAQLNRFLARHYTPVRLGRPFYVRNDLLAKARAEGIELPPASGPPIPPMEEALTSTGPDRAPQEEASREHRG